MKLAVVDVETSGGQASVDRVVEIGLVLMDDGRIVNRFQSLIHPEVYISAALTAIHGISNEMVKDAPRFAEIAPQLMEMLEGRIFVAHNVHFDYGFIEAEFSRAGYEFRARKLCTVRLSRRLLGLRSHSLAALCLHFSIVNQQAHRALEDAAATAEVLLRLLPMPGCSELIAGMIKGRAGTFKGPGNLPEEKLREVPEKTGVYLFYDASGKVIYVGKANNLRERVHQHFGAQTHTKEKRQFLESVYDLRFEICGHELMALLMENDLIKKHYPRFNRLNKDFRLNHGIYTFEDQRGYKRLILGQSGKWSRPLQVFRSRAEAVQALLKLSMEHGLCLHLNGLTSAASPECSYETPEGKQCIFCKGMGPEQYNAAVEKVCQRHFSEGRLLLQMQGREEDECAVVLLESGRITGYGFVQREEMKKPLLPKIREKLQPYYDTQDAQAILQPWLPESFHFGAGPEESSESASGNKNDKEKLLKLTFLSDSKEISVVMEDQGSGFDYSILPNPTTSENLLKPDGKGVF